MSTKIITIANVTDVLIDKHNRPYRLIYTPETWAMNEETNRPTKTQSEKHFCYDESMFEFLEEGMELEVISN
tara:strand:- start:258 stop:473 length:216 start_codon:yes stop_codon:yes gene_type:complete